MVYDLIVVGLGAMGSATLYQAAKRGANVLGIDRYDPPHSNGSTHGETRVTRLAVGEGDEYIPLVRRTHEIWRELEAETKVALLHECGAYIVSPVGISHGWREEGNFAEESAELAVRYNIPHELLSAAEVRDRHPVIRLQDSEMAYFEPSGGIVDPEAAVRVQLQLAAQLGAKIHTNEQVLSVDATQSGVSVVTTQGHYSAAQAVVAAGSWVKQFLPEQHQQSFGIYRQVMYWFETEDPARFAIDQFPMLMWPGIEHADYFGAFPNATSDQPAVKLLTEQFVDQCDPDSVKRDVTDAEIATFTDRFVMTRLTGLTGRCLRAGACMYTMTSDTHFVIDKHPDSARIIVASPCSGHGFKHSAAIGESIAQWALEGRSNINLSKFAFERFR